MENTEENVPTLSNAAERTFVLPDVRAIVAANLAEQMNTVLARVFPNCSAISIRNLSAKLRVQLDQQFLQMGCSDDTDFLVRMMTIRNEEESAAFLEEIVPRVFEEICDELPHMIKTEGPCLE